jgi:hypothetical protein
VRAANADTARVSAASGGFPDAALTAAYERVSRYFALGVVLAFSPLWLGFLFWALFWELF